MITESNRCEYSYSIVMVLSIVLGSLCAGSVHGQVNVAPPSGTAKQRSEGQDLKLDTVGELGGSLTAAIDGILQCELGIATCYDSVSRDSFIKSALERLADEKGKHEVWRWIVQSHAFEKGARKRSYLRPSLVVVEFGTSQAKGKSKYVGTTRRVVRSWNDADTALKELVGDERREGIVPTEKTAQAPVFVSVMQRLPVPGERSSGDFSMQVDFVWQTFDAAEASTGFVVSRAHFLWKDGNWNRSSRDGDQ